MSTRRQFLFTAGIASIARAATLSPKQRLDRIREGKDTDRLAFSCWYHFLDHGQPAHVHAANTLNFHRKFRTDYVKVMSDYPFPKPSGPWHNIRVSTNPFPQQIRALELIRDGLASSAYFIETVFNPYNIAEKLSSKEQLKRMMYDNPKALHAALEAIAQSQAHHARRAIAAGAAGIFLAIANAQEGVLTQTQYREFSAPYDRIVLDAVKSAPWNTLHLHGSRVYWEQFLRWPFTAINYSRSETGISVSKLRSGFGGVILAGIDEVNFRTLTASDLKRQIASAEAGPKYIVTPGCSLPNETKDDEVLRLTRLVGA